MVGAEEGEGFGGFVSNIAGALSCALKGSIDRLHQEKICTLCRAHETCLKRNREQFS